MDSSSEVVSRVVIETRSRIKVWWMTKFAGYRVRRQIQRPGKGILGGVRCVDIWRLEAKGGEAKGQAKARVPDSLPGF